MMKYGRLLLLGLLLSSLVACTKDAPVPSPDGSVTLNCKQPEYLKAGDKVALISPSYFTPMENVEKTADVRSDGATLQFNVEGQQQPVKTAEVTTAQTSLSRRLKLAGKMN